MPITFVFESKEELTEAINNGAVYGNMLKTYKGTYPLLHRQTDGGSVNSYAGSFMTNVNEVLSLAKYLAYWKDVRTEYLAPKWYELEVNRGKYIMVKDEADHEWDVRKFVGYDPTKAAPFLTEYGQVWCIAAPLSSRDTHIKGDL